MDLFHELRPFAGYKAHLVQWLGFRRLAEPQDGWHVARWVCITGPYTGNETPAHRKAWIDDLDDLLEQEWIEY
jgi:hypothetical protein